MKFYPTYLQTFGVLLIWLGCGIISAILCFPFYSIESYIGITLIYLSSTTVTIWITLRRRNNFEFARKKVSPVLIFVAFVITIGWDFFSDPLMSLIPLSESYKEMLLGTIEYPILTFFVSVIGAPILEELLFRGVILDGLIKNYDPRRAIAFSAFVFALAHGNLAQGINSFILGVLLGWIYWRTESVIPGIFIHFINNLVSFLGTILPGKENIDTNLFDQLGDPVGYWLLIVVSGFASLSGVWFLNRIYFKGKSLK